MLMPLYMTLVLLSAHLPAQDAQDSHVACTANEYYVAASVIACRLVRCSRIRCAYKTTKALTQHKKWRGQRAHEGGGVEGRGASIVMRPPLRHVHIGYRIAFLGLTIRNDWPDCIAEAPFHPAAIYRWTNLVVHGCDNPQTPCSG